MNNLLLEIISPSSCSHEIGHAIIRIGAGILFLIFGYSKLTSGASHLTEIGSAMAAFGITHGYLFWGYMAALTEFLAGISFIFGFLTRLSSAPLIWLLIVAITFHINKGDAFFTWGFAFICLCVAIGLFFAGSGIYSLDYALLSYQLRGSSN